jgi:hypothetical protein
MSLAQKVRLELEDGREIEAVYDGRDIRAWEGKFRQSSLTADMSVSMLSWLGWHAAVRQNLVNGELSTWEKFDAACVDVSGVREPDPTPVKKKGAATRKAPGGGSSAP